MTTTPQASDELRDALYDMAIEIKQDSDTGERFYTLPESELADLLTKQREQARQEAFDALEAYIFEGTADEGEMGYGEIVTKIDEYRDKLASHRQPHVEKESDEIT